MTKYGFLSTYPPTQCGLATFTRSLASAMTEQRLGDAVIVRLLDGAVPSSETRFGDLPVAAELIRGDRASAAAAARVLNNCDIAIVQHEYGIYGGIDGDEVIDVLKALTVSTIVVLHTVLPSPTRGQRAVLEEVAGLASTVIVMSEHARGLLASNYRVSMTKVRVIPHGVPDRAAPAPAGHGRRLITWGLIGPGKGIEWGIRAMAELADMQPRPHYTVIGRTHPKVQERFGETYRTGLQQLVRDLGLEDVVEFVGEYLDSAELGRLVAASDAVLLPYDSHDQVTSGVLIEAVAAGKPVISTGFPHAIELLSGGAGIIVPHQDPAAIAAAVRSVLSGGEQAERMADAASRASIGTSWSAVAAQYGALTEAILSGRAA